LTIACFCCLHDDVGKDGAFRDGDGFRDWGGLVVSTVGNHHACVNSRDAFIAANDDSSGHNISCHGGAVNQQDVRDAISD